MANNIALERYVSKYSGNKIDAAVDKVMQLEGVTGADIKESTQYVETLITGNITASQLVETTQVLNKSTTTSYCMLVPKSAEAGSNTRIKWVSTDDSRIIATSEKLGFVKIGYSENNSGVASNRNYAVKLDNENKAYVNVPWINPQKNIATSDVAGSIKIGYSQNDRNYPVLLDGNDKAYVKVPWKNTTYESEDAAEGGTAYSLVTTGEKFIWNNKQNALSPGDNIQLNGNIISATTYTAKTGGGLKIEQSQPGQSIFTFAIDTDGAQNDQVLKKTSNGLVWDSVGINSWRPVKIDGTLALNSEIGDSNSLNLVSNNIIKTNWDDSNKNLSFTLSELPSAINVYTLAMSMVETAPNYLRILNKLPILVNIYTNGIMTQVASNVYLQCDSIEYDGINLVPNIYYYKGIDSNNHSYTVKIQKIPNGLQLTLIDYSTLFFDATDIFDRSDPSSSIPINSSTNKPLYDSISTFGFPEKLICKDVRTGKTYTLVCIGSNPISSGTIVFVQYVLNTASETFQINFTWQPSSGGSAIYSISPLTYSAGAGVLISNDHVISTVNPTIDASSVFTLYGYDSSVGQDYNFIKEISSITDSTITNAIINQYQLQTRYMEGVGIGSDMQVFTLSCKGNYTTSDGHQEYVHWIYELNGNSKNTFNVKLEIKALRDNAGNYSNFSAKYSVLPAIIDISTLSGESFLQISTSQSYQKILSRSNAKEAQLIDNLISEINSLIQFTNSYSISSYSYPELHYQCRSMVISAISTVTTAYQFMCIEDSIIYKLRIQKTVDTSVGTEEWTLNISISNL